MKELVQENPLETSPFLIDDSELIHVANARHDLGEDLYRNLDIVQDKHQRFFARIAHPVETESRAYSKRSPEIQAIISMVLKGIARVADVIPVRVQNQKRPAYYSRMIPLSEIRDIPHADEIFADFFILESIFSDFDHTVDTRNIHIEGAQYYFFDFGSANIRRWLEPERLSNLVRSYKEEYGIAEHFFKVLDKKLDLLKNRFSGDDGLLLWKSIFERISRFDSEFEINTFYYPEDVYRTFMENLSTVQNALRNEVETL